VHQCEQCGTALDRLSTALMRTGAGQAYLNKQSQEVLVKTKSEDAAFMEQHRARLDEEERNRIRALQAQKAESVKQQRLVIWLTMAGVGVLMILAIVVWYVTR
jgi:hypothetical protein